MHEIYPWQHEQWQYLLTRYENNNLPHALLLVGQSGLGKTSFAYALAELLLDEKTDAKASKLLEAGNHPDLKLITPEDKIIKIEQIRNAIEFVSKKSHQNKYKVIIIKPAHAMNIAASNALLKTLEEPSEDTIIILITDQPSLLLPTIRSRCQRIDFYPPAKEIAKKWCDSDLLLALAENAPLLARKLAEEGALLERDQLFNAFADLLLKKLDPIKFAEIYLKVDLPVALKYLQSWLLDLIKIKFSVVNKFLLNIDKTNELSNLAQTIDLNNLFKNIDQLIEYKKYIGNNLNAQLVLEDFAVGLSCEALRSASGVERSRKQEC